MVLSTCVEFVERHSGQIFAQASAFAGAEGNDLGVGRELLRAVLAHHKIPVGLELVRLGEDLGVRVDRSQEREHLGSGWNLVLTYSVAAREGERTKVVVF